jgi:hypothetical protein
LRFFRWVSQYLPVITPYLRVAHKSREEAARGTNVNMTFFALVQKVVLTHPGIETRNYDLHRTQDWLLYLLSEERRQRHLGVEEAADIGSQIVNGAQELPCVYAEAPDHPLRYSSAFEVQVLARYLDDITTDHLRLVYDPLEMEAHRVYKFRAWKAEWAWLHILEVFEEFRAFYQEVAAAQEGMLVITD